MTTGKASSGRHTPGRPSLHRKLLSKQLFRAACLRLGDVREVTYTLNKRARPVDEAEDNVYIIGEVYHYYLLDLVDDSVRGLLFDASDQYVRALLCCLLGLGKFDQSQVAVGDDTVSVELH